MVQTRAVKRRRAGRKRQAGARYGGGKLKTAPERGWAHMNTVLVARCLHNGLRLTDDNLRAMRDPLNGSELGRLYLHKHISEAQYNGAQKYHAAYLGWAKAAGMPRITPKASSYGLTVAGRSEVSDEVAHAAEGAYWDAAHALITAGMLAEHLVKRLVLEDAAVVQMEGLSRGLDALAAHFGYS